MNGLAFMLQRRWWSVYRSMAFLGLLYMYGSYESERYDQQYMTTFRNKSKLFGGRELPPGTEAW